MDWEFLDSSDNIIILQPKFSMIVSHARLKVKATIDHLGMTWLLKSMVTQELTTRQLREILSESNMRYSGYFMYYPSQNAELPLFRLFIEAMRLD
ncbi:type 2 periplasmic-binding domain-containing protein [Acinetobacter sp. ANC 4640]